jgi:choline dehydrogenase
MHFINSPYDWQHKMRRGKKGISTMIHGGKVLLPTGRELGGSSMMNWMIYMRPHPKDFDDWQEMGLEGWGFEHVEPFFKKMERFVGPNPDDTYGTEGREGIF